MQAQRHNTTCPTIRNFIHNRFNCSACAFVLCDLNGIKHKNLHAATLPSTHSESDIYVTTTTLERASILSLSSRPR